MNQFGTNDTKAGETGVWLSIITYVLLSTVKIWVGYLTDSAALSADGLNNTTDIIASVAVLIGLKISRKPPDHDHPYGHSRAETIASLVASFIMVSVGLQVLSQAVQSIFSEKTVIPDLTAAWVAVAAALIMYWVYRFNLKVARTTHSQAMMATAQDNRSDALVSVGTAIGIFGAQYGLPWLDPLAALIVGLMIVKTAWDIFRNASHALTDGFDESLLRKLRQTIEHIPGVESIQDIKARIHGANLLLDVVIEVDPLLNVIESHRITERIEEQMLEKHRIQYVHVHVEPKGE